MSRNVSRSSSVSRNRSRSRSRRRSWSRRAMVSKGQTKLEQQRTRRVEKRREESVAQELRRKKVEKERAKAIPPSATSNLSSRKAEAPLFHASATSHCSSSTESGQLPSE